MKVRLLRIPQIIKYLDNQMGEARRTSPNNQEEVMNINIDHIEFIMQDTERQLNLDKVANIDWYEVSEEKIGRIVAILMEED